LLYNFLIHETITSTRFRKTNRMKKLTTMFRFDLLNLIYPSVCAGTGQLLLPTEQHVSQFCFAKLPQTNFFNHPDQNMLLDQFIVSPAIRMAVAGYWYNSSEPLSRIMHKLKYNDRPQIGHTLGYQLGTDTASSLFWKDVDCLMPIPLHRERLRKRGYNQAEMIANGLASATKIPVETIVLQRTRNNSTQTKLNREQRLKNTEGLFTATKNNYNCVVIVDDIITTGATIAAAAHALAQSGVAEVRVCSIGAAAF
jgi:ComF family protein